MSDVYAPKRRRVAKITKRWNSGVVTLTRTTNEASEEATPWIKGAVITEEVYTLDAVVSEVAAEYVDNTLVVASDLMVVASTDALLSGEVIALEPQMGDVLTIDGNPKEIKRILPSPAAGAAAIFRIFVASGS